MSLSYMRNLFVAVLGWYPTIFLFKRLLIVRIVHT